jgi:cytosine/adenosine deaminase-related metal-dependent hydrolase
MPEAATKSVPSAAMLILHAKTVLPVDTEAISDGAVAVAGHQIKAIGPWQKLHQTFPKAETIDLTDCVLLPGLVNAHTHLEFSNLKGQLPEGDFIEWLGHLKGHLKETHGPGNMAVLAEAIAQGCRGSLRGGVTTVADICIENQARQFLVEQPIRKACFAEVLGLSADVTAARDYLTKCVEGFTANPLLRLGISPHAPYSTGPRVYELAAELAERYNLLLTTHLSEMPAERQFCLNGSGPWVDYLKDIKRWDGTFECPHLTPVDYFLKMKLHGRSFLLAHVNYISDDELERLAETPHSVVYCPRSHRFFGHKNHRFMDMLAKGINVALGTDSLASNDTLSILDEMRFIHRERPDVPLDTILRMATINGARALDWDDTTGSISAGKEADIIAIPLTGGSDDGLADILESQAMVKMVMLRGEGQEIVNPDKSGQVSE